MNSNTEKRFKAILNNLSKYINVDKEQFLIDKIKVRLDTCLNKYIKDLDDSVDRISDYSEKYLLYILKNLNKQEK